MKPRARRITIGAAALVAVLVAVLVVANWPTVRDHVEAWHFQLTRKTEICEPGPLTALTEEFFEARCFQILSTYSNCRVVIDATVAREYGERWIWRVERSFPLTADAVLHEFREDGWRILEQRFPRKAYVVIEPPDPLAEVVPRKVWSTQ